DGIRTSDIYLEGISKQKVGTKEFAQAVMERLGQEPETMKPAKFLTQTGDDHSRTIKLKERKPAVKELIGLDVFIDSKERTRDGNVVADRSQAIDADGLRAQLMTHRGVKLSPDGVPQPFCSDHWRVKFLNAE